MQSTEPTQVSGWMGKYRSIIFAIGLFIVFDLAVLVATFFASHQIAEDTVALSLANRQRMLSQRIAKSIHVAESDQAATQPINGALKELKSATALFDTTHRGFRAGGAGEDNAGQDMRLKALDDIGQQELLKQVGALWAPYLVQIELLMGSAAPATETIRKAADYSRANSTKILDLSTQLSAQIEAGVKEKINALRTIQIAGILLALANLAYIVFVLVRKLRAADELIDQRHREHTQIMATVREGLFLLNKDGTIGSQMSASFPLVMGQRASPGMDFLSILKNLVPGKDYEAATEYVNLLFGDRVKESLVASLNPLSQLELRSSDEAGDMTSRFISLQFSRVKTGREITHLLVTAQDISDRVRLTQAVKDAEARAQEEIKGLLDLLELEPAVSKRFLIDTEQSLDAINDALRGAGQTRDYPSTISEIFRRVHKLKGEATVHNLTLFETLAHRFETMLSELRDRPNLNGDDLLAIPPHLEDIYSRTAKLRALAERMSSKDAHLVQSAASGHEFGYMLEALAEKVSANQKKKVRVLADVPDYGTLPESKAAMLRDIAIQLVRNAVVHGIEDANERVMSSKTETGSIHVTLRRLDADKFEFAVRDDGRGVIPEHIRESLVKSGRYSRAQADALDERALVMKLFEPGVSTSATIDNDAGRGVGLDVVAEKVKAMGAQIRLGTRPNLFTQFNIIFAAAA
jgi:two-component system, chemotaxis family, sensor kinase CheA